MTPASLKGEEPLVSIVLLCWNRWEDVRESLTRIREIDYESLEVVVVDNNSTDGTQEGIKNDFPEVRLLKMAENLGIAAYNHGFEAAEGEYIVILDDDSFPAKDAVARMVKKFEADEKLGVCAFDVRNFANYEEVAKEEPTAEAAKTKLYGTGFNGAGAGVRKKIFKEVGYYPAEFFLYMNEADCSLRIRNAGYEIVFFPDLVSYHKMAAKNRKSWRAPFYYTRNSFWLVWKNYPMGKAVCRTMGLIYRCLFHSLEQRTIIYLKAMVSAFVQIGALKGKRSPINSSIVDEVRIPLNLPFTFYR